MDGIDERIESFFRGEMTEEEEEAFRQEIHTDSELRNRALTNALLIKGIQKREGQKEQKIIQDIYDTPSAPASGWWKRYATHLRTSTAHFSLEKNEQQEIKDIVLSQTKKEEKSRHRPILWLVCSVAAVIAVIFVFYPGMDLMSPSRDDRKALLDATVSPYYTEYDINGICRGDIDSVTIAHLYGLFAQIQENKNVSDIIKELEPIYKSIDDDFTYNAYANDIVWNLALAYVKDDQIDKAITILQKLKADNPDTPIYNKADELLKKLQDL